MTDFATSQTSAQRFESGARWISYIRSKYGDGRAIECAVAMQRDQGLDARALLAPSTHSPMEQAR